MEDPLIINSRIRAGDLVKFIKNPVAPPPYIIPKEKPLGIVIKIEVFTIGEESDPQAYMEIVRVWWNIPSWNGPDGLSEEIASDLYVIQSVSDL